MPRKLLRVALVAAVLPALTPEISSAQTAKIGPPVRTAQQAPAQKKGITGWWQRVRGQQPETAATGTAARVVRVSAELPAQATPVQTDQSFELEGSSDVELLRRESGRRRPSLEQSAAPTTTLDTAVVTQADRAAFENPFPDDAPTRRRNRPASQEIATPVEQRDIATAVEPEITTVAAPGDAAESFAAPVGEGPEAYPIEGAAPPADVTAGYSSPQGNVPQYDRTGMMAPNDVSFANPIPARPTGQIMNGMNGGVPTYQAPATTYYGNPGIARVDGALYPSPQPGIPPYVGQTMITNPAFDPHEMLYAHRYRGLYGPFYHKTCRHWVLTPFGVCKSEKRILMGTEVRVNYKSHISPFALFWPPVSY